MNKFIKPFYAFFALGVLGIVVLEIVNSRFWLNDFRVYYGAAKAFVAGEQVYQRVFGEDTGLYKYSPVLLWFFAPLTFLPYVVACIIHVFTIAISYVVVLRVGTHLVKQQLQLNTINKPVVWLLVLVFTGNHFFREIHLGNVNVLLVAILLLGYHLQQNGRFVFAGFLFTIAILMKPYFLILAFTFLLAKRWQILISSTISLFFVLGVFFWMTGFEKAFFLHREWITSMLNHNEFLFSANTVTSLVGVAAGQTVNVYLSNGLFILGYFSLFYLLKPSPKFFIGAREQYLIFITLLALIPNLVITDTEHFLFSLPLLIALAFQLRAQPKPIHVGAAIVLAFAYSANLGDLVGGSFSDKMELSGVLGLGNILLVVLSTVLILRTDINKLEKSIV